MIKLRTFILFLTLICFANYGTAQTNHAVSVGNNFFSPATLTITQGDMVTWTNGGGFHNVNASTSIYPSNPVGFMNGPASTSAWTFSFTFNTPGTYTYQCDPHAGGGMVGTIIVNAPAAIPLCGTYNIGGGTPDYPDLATAVADLAANGVSCAVTFNVAAGSYTGAVSIPEIVGASATNTITIDGGTAATTSIVHSGTTQNAVILLDSANYVTIKNLTLHHPATAGPAWGVRLNNDANHNTIDNCIITLEAGLTAFQHMVGVLGNSSATSSSTSGSNCNHLTISNNEITGGYYAIRMEGGNNGGGDLDSNIIITNNVMDGNAGYGMVIDDIIGLTISDNQISGHSVNSKDGMDLNDVTDFYITGNTVDVPDWGIDMDDGNHISDGVLATGKSTIINNMLHSSEDEAMNLDDVAEIDVFHNTCVTTATAGGQRALQFRDATNVTFKNNMFIGSGNEAVYITTSANSGIVMDYNIYYTTGSVLAFDGSNQADLVTWQASNTSFNANSIQGNPTFMSATDFHMNPSDGLANDVGDNSVGVTTDIDGDTRPFVGSTTVDIGADEYDAIMPTTPVANDDTETTDENTAVTVNILANDNTPNALDSIVIVTQPTNGTVMVNGIIDVTYTPNMGFCGSTDMFTYAICDMSGCDTATVTVTVDCAISYPLYNIAQVHTEDMNGVADSLNVLCELRGVVYGIDMDGNAGISFTIRDNTGGINVFNFNDVDNYVVTEGDSIHVKGDIGQYNGLTQISPDSIKLISSGNAIKMPTIVTMLDETTESDLIRLNNLTLVTPSQWPASGSANVDISDGSNTFTMRIDSDTDIDGTPAPTGTFDLIGIGGQFDNSSPYDGGYQILPRTSADILPHPVLNPIVQFSGNAATVDETIGSVSVDIMIASPNANMTSVDVSVGTASTATSGMDYTFTTPVTVTFPASSSANQMVTVTIIDDALIESSETIVLELSNPTNNATLGIDSVYTITINDDDSPIPTDLIITGVFDATLPGGLPKGVEFYALNNIPDLSVYGFGSANNGGGTDGQEFTFPAVAATAGQFIYVATDTAQFSAFFGFHADYEGGMASSINGDDAIELFGGGQVIDVFGDINVDGTGEPWDYVDGWAYRKCATGPDDSTFVLANWTFSGIDVFDGQSTNASTPISMPVGTYNTVCPMNPIANDDLVSIDEDEVVTIDILGNDNVPNPLDSIVIVTPPLFGTVVVNGVADVTYTPNPGACDLIDDFEYAICDATGCDTALVEIDIACLPDYPYYPIADVHTEDANGVPDSLGLDYELRGVVYCGDFDGNNGYSFTMIDPSGGINVFSFVDVSGYVVAEGDSIHVFGVIENYNGLTEIVPDSIALISSGNPINPPTIVTALDETTESQYIKVLNLSIVDPAQWLSSGSFNADFTDGTNTYTVRVDSDTDIAGTPAPTVAVNITGLGGQFDNSVPHTEGYQIFPCSLTDIVPSVNTNEIELAGKVRFFPNPANATLYIQSEIDIETIRITNVLGQETLSLNNPRNQENIDVSKLVNGVYFITFVSEGVTYTEELIISH